MNEKIPLYVSGIFILLTLSLFFMFMNGFRYGINRVDYSEAKRSRNFIIVPSVLVFWLGLLAVLSLEGFFLNFDSVPPKFAFIIIPVVLAIVFFVFSGKLDNILKKIPMAWLINFQMFRIAMEIILWLLFVENIIPVQMTFEGYNFDILVGLSAPIISYLLYKRGKARYTIVFVWNILGIAVLTNIVTIAIISTPSVFRYFMNEPTNTMIAYYPFVWLPGFVVPLALLMHLASIRQIILKQVKILEF